MPLPDGMSSEVLTKRFFAKVYGFTEEMTDDLSVDAVTWWPVIERAESEASERMMKDAQRAQRYGGR